MNIAIIMFQNMRHAPYLEFYERILKEIDNISYDVIYLNRHPELKEIEDEHHIAVSWPEWNVAIEKLGKIVGSLRYGMAVKKLINKKKYDRLIILTTLPAVILQPLLCKKYDNRYIVDIRDYTRENSKVFWNRETKAVRHSMMNIISSPAFVTFLPEAEYQLCHNQNIVSNDMDYLETHLFHKRIQPVIISYIGIIQYAKQCKRLIDLVKEDPRFEFRFYGPEGGKREVLNYAEQQHCDRIKVEGSFLPEEKARIYGESDLIFNCYGNNSQLVRCAISNKHYDGAQYRKPLLVSPGTIMADLAGKYAYALDLQLENSLTELYNWYISIDNQKYEAYAKNVIDEARETNMKTADKIKSLLV